MRGPCVQGFFTTTPPPSPPLLFSLASCLLPSLPFFSCFILTSTRHAAEHQDAGPISTGPRVQERHIPIPGLAIIAVETANATNSGRGILWLAILARKKCPIPWSAPPSTCTNVIERPSLPDPAACLCSPPATSTLLVAMRSETFRKQLPHNEDSTH